MCGGVATIQMDTDEADRRARLLQAVEGDNWSAEIEAQTQATIDQLRKRATAAASAAPAMPPTGGGNGAIESPFANGGGSQATGKKEEQLVLNAVNVDKVREEEEAESILGSCSHDLFLWREGEEESILGSCCHYSSLWCCLHPPL